MTIKALRISALSPENEMSETIGLNGIILSSQPIGEYDRRVVILTKERGKIACFAKGARRPTSHLAGLTRVFSFGTFFVYEGRSSYSIHGAEIKNYFENVLKDYDSTLYACYFCEIADYYGREGLEAKDAINLLYAAISSLTRQSPERKLSKAVYEIRVVSDQGECPPLDKLFASPSDVLSANTLNAFNYVLTCDTDKLFKFTVGDDTIKQMEMISEKIISYAIDKKLKSKEMLPQ